MYMITDGRMYLMRSKKGVYSLGSKNLAEVFDNKEKADNVLNSSIGKKLRAKCYVILEKNTTREIKNNKEEKQTASKKYDDLDELKNSIVEFQSFACNVEQKMDELSSQLSDVDQEITDINHYIEFKNLNAYQGWIAYQMLKMRFERRRKIKNNIAILQSLMDAKLSSKCLNSVLNKINDISSLTYEPRKLKNLFDNEKEVHYEL